MPAFPVNQHQAELALLSAFRPGIGQPDELPRLANPAQPGVAEKLCPEFRRLAGARPEHEVEQG